MVTYRQPCIHCNTYIDSDSRFCPTCGSKSPFGYTCPTCKTPIKKEQNICSGCGRILRIVCPHCGQQTFVSDKCEHCKQSLLVKCANPRCGEFQFFENEKCASCGKRIRLAREKTRDKKGRRNAGGVFK